MKFLLPLRSNREALSKIATCNVSYWCERKSVIGWRFTSILCVHCQNLVRSYSKQSGNRRQPFHLTIQNFSSGRKQTLGGAVSILRRLQEETGSILQWCRENPNATKTITSDPFFRAMAGWVEYSKHHCSLEGAHTAAKLLRVMKDTPSTSALVQTKHIDLVLEAYAVCNGGVEAAQAATNILSQPHIPLGTSSHSVKSYNIVLKSWARTTQYRDAGIQTQVIIDRMCEQEVWPDERSLVSHFEAWANSGHAEAPELVSSTLQLVLQETATNNRKKNSKFRHVTVDSAVFHAVMHTWVQSGRGRTAATKAEQVLSSMSQYGFAPDTLTYSLVISAWKQVEMKERRGDGARRAETIFDSMVLLYRQGRTEVIPNAILATTCIAAWSHVTQQPKAPEHAERLFRNLVSLYTESRGLPELQPTTTAANAVLSAWSRSRCRADALTRALDFLQTQVPKPDVISYNTVLDAMAKRGLGRQALNLFEAILNPKVEPSIRPDRVTHNSVLAALSRDATFSPNETEEFLLQRMAEQDDPQIQPDNVSYTLVLSAWSRSDEPEKVQRAYRLVTGMVSRHRERRFTKPDQLIFCTLIKVCCGAGDREREAALVVAFQAMEAMETGEYGPPTETAYALLLRAIRLCATRNDGYSRDALQDKVFHTCARAGLASQAALNELQPNIGRRLAEKFSLPWKRKIVLNQRAKRNLQPLA